MTAAQLLGAIIEALAPCAVLFGLILGAGLALRPSGKDRG